MYRNHTKIYKDHTKKYTIIIFHIHLIIINKNHAKNIQKSHLEIYRNQSKKYENHRKNYTNITLKNTQKYHIKI